jgi:hypothetical protein
MIDFRNEIARLRLSGSSRQKQKEDADRMLEAIAGREEISAEERARRASRAQEMQTVSVEEMARRKSAAIERRIGEVQRRIDRLIERSRELELTLSEDPSDENMQRMIDFRNEIARLRLSQNSGQRQKENIENRVPIFVLWEG